MNQPLYIPWYARVYGQNERAFCCEVIDETKDARRFFPRMSAHHKFRVREAFKRRDAKRERECARRLKG